MGGACARLLAGHWSPGGSLPRASEIEARPSGGRVAASPTEQTTTSHVSVCASCTVPSALLPPMAPPISRHQKGWAVRVME